MLKKLAIGTGALALTASFAVAAPASAAPANEGAACVQAGLSTLKSLPGSAVGVPEERTALLAAAKKKIDYNDVLPAVFPDGTFLSLGQVVKAHTTNPELFPWCQA
ncbi:MAG: hypothetical protein MUF35_12270 [Candidatus Nanopelagicales bacterium]|jgi:hypothetical protein|nr:hypothetical protein [Candidatus Nanopelagicales bacterium]